MGGCGACGGSQKGASCGSEYQQQAPGAPVIGPSLPGRSLWQGRKVERETRAARQCLVCYQLARRGPSPPALPGALSSASRSACICRRETSGVTTRHHRAWDVLAASRRGSGFSSRPGLRTGGSVPERLCWLTVLGGASSPFSEQLPSVKTLLWCQDGQGLGYQFVPLKHHFSPLVAFSDQAVTKLCVMKQDAQDTVVVPVSQARNGCVPSPPPGPGFSKASFSSCHHCSSY